MSENKSRPSMLSVRLSKSEQDAVRAAAERRGESVSGFLRRASLTEAGVRRRGGMPSPSTTRSATIGAVVQYTESGQLVASRLSTPSGAPDVDLSPLPLSAHGDFSQRAHRGVRDFTARFDEEGNSGDETVA